MTRHELLLINNCTDLSPGALFNEKLYRLYLPDFTRARNEDKKKYNSSAGLYKGKKLYSYYLPDLTHSPQDKMKKKIKVEQKRTDL